MKTFISILMIFAIISSNACVDVPQKKLPPKEKWSHVSIKAVVESIDYKMRQAILKGPRGYHVTIKVDERVKRLNEVKVGDTVSTDYWTYIKAEFRVPTPAEIEIPLVVLTEAGKAHEGMPPSAEVGAVVRAVVRIEYINRKDMEVTIRGPRGKYVTLPVVDGDLLKQLYAADMVILTYAEALALSLEKSE
jgi:hypothetical protein